MKRKIFSILTLLITLITLLPSSYAVEDDVPVPDRFFSAVAQQSLSESSKAGYDLLKYIGAVDFLESDISPAKAVTRAEGVSLVMRMITGNTGVSATTQPYSDVALKHKYADEISMVKQLTLSDSLDKFKPDEPLSAKILAELVLKAYGMDFIVKNGQYYMYGKTNKLFSGVNVSPDSTITWEQLFIILKNALHMYVPGEITYGNKGMTASIDYSVDFLQKKHNIVVQKGIVTAVGNVGIYNKSDLYINEVEINRNIYKTDFTFDLDLIGRNVEAYVELKNGKDILITLYEINNKVTEIGKFVFENLKGGYFNYIEDGSDKEKRIAYEADAAVLFNDVYCGSVSSSASLFEKENRYTLVDNDNDNKAEVIFISKSEEFVVDAFSSISEIIAFFYDAPALKLKDEKIKLVYFEVNGEPAEVGDLKQYDVLSLKKGTYSDGTYLYRLDVWRENIEGVIAEKTVVSDKEIYYTINDERYLLTPSYLTYLKGQHSELIPNIGENAIFYLTKDKEIAASKINDPYMHGYLMATAEGDMTEDAKLKLFGTDGKEHIFTFAKKVVFYDGISTQRQIKKSEDVEKALSRKATPIAYKADGEILTEVALPLDRRGYAHGTISYPFTKDYVLTSGERLYSNFINSAYYVRHAYGILYPGSLDNTYSLPDKDDFLAISYLSNMFSDDYYFKDETVTLYNVNEFFIPSFVTVGSNTASGADVAKVDDFTQSVMVEKIVQACDDKGNPCLKLRYMGKNGITSKLINEDAEMENLSGGNFYGAVSEIEKLGFGDVIQIKEDLQGNIEYIRVLFKYSDPGDYRVQGGAHNVIDTPVKKNIMTRIAVIYAKAVKKSGTTVLVNIADDNATTDIIFPIAITALYDSNTFVVLDSKAQKLYNATREEILPGDILVMRKRYNVVSEVFILR